MGLFDRLKERSSSGTPAKPVFPAELGAVSEGALVHMEQIPDEVFSTGVLGACCGVEPTVGRVYAPVDGTISQLADTLHAVGMEAGGMDILIHAGVDTVDMNGNGFSTMVRLGQTVRKGDLLLTMDLDKIRAAGHPATVILAVTNSSDFSAVEPAAATLVKPGDCILRVSK